MCLQHWQADSPPLTTREAPVSIFYFSYSDSISEPLFNLFLFSRAHSASGTGPPGSWDILNSERENVTSRVSKFISLGIDNGSQVILPPDRLREAYTKVLSAPTITK